MLYKQTTQVPNFLFDTFLPELTEAELKVLLTVIRQTLGWIDKRTGQRKLKDRISAQQFKQKTGLSQRCLTKTIQSLLVKNLVHVTDAAGNKLHQSHERKGKTHLFYSLSRPPHFEAPTSAQSVHEPQHKGANNKTNFTKTTKTKLTHIGQLLPQKETLFRFGKN